MLEARTIDVFLRLADRRIRIRHHEDGIRSTGSRLVLCCWLMLEVNRFHE